MFLIIGYERHKKYGNEVSWFVKNKRRASYKSILNLLKQTANEMIFRIDSSKLTNPQSYYFCWSFSGNLV